MNGDWNIPNVRDKGDLIRWSKYNQKNASKAYLEQFQNDMRRTRPDEFDLREEVKLFLEEQTVRRQPGGSG